VKKEFLFISMHLVFPCFQQAELFNSLKRFGIRYDNAFEGMMRMLRKVRFLWCNDFLFFWNAHVSHFRYLFGERLCLLYVTVNENGPLRFQLGY